MGLNRCGDSCTYIKKEKRKICMAKRQCACDVCARWQAISPNLHEACVQMCNIDDDTKRPKTEAEFLKGFSPEDLFSRFGYKVEGFEIEKTFEYQKVKEQQEAVNNNQSFFQKLILWGGGLLVVVIVFLLFRKSE